MSMNLARSGEHTGYYKESITTTHSSSKGFEGFSLNPKLVKTLRDISFLHPTPIQAQAIPVVLSGNDLIGNAQTGTGKTAAFVLPLLTRLLAEPQTKFRASGPEVLILAPTRELAAQIHENTRTLAMGTGIRASVIYGGIRQGNKVRDLERNSPRILVATPGRLLDLVNQRYLKLSSVNVLVL